MDTDERPQRYDIELSPPEEKRPCCGVLKIQSHTPDCDGKPRRRGTRGAA